MASVVGAGIAPVRRIPAASTSGFPAAAMHRPLPAAGVGARSRSPATYVLRRRSATARARGARSGAMTFARARVAPGGFQARFTRDDTGSATSRDLVGMACRAFVLRRERLIRRVATRASSGDGESLERRRSSLPRERNDETPTTSALGRVFGAGDDASSTARDALAAVTVAYAFAAWRLLQWPATTPAASSVPGPLLACAVAAGATAVAAPLLAAAAHPAANYGVRFPLLTRAAFGVEGAKALVSARRLVCSGLCALHFLAGADALHVLSATLAPGSSVLGNGAWSSALCYLLAWLAQSPAGATFCRAALVKAGGAFAVVAALSAAKAAAFAPAAAAKAAASAAAASGAPSSGHVSADIGLAIVGVWFAMSSSFLDTAASATVRAATQATKLGEALPPAGDRAAAYARRLPFAAALAAAALSSALNPSGAFGAELGGAMSSWLLPLLVAVAAPAATATLRGGGADLNGRGSTTVSEANVALFAAAATLFSAGVPARGAAAAAAFAGGGAFAAAASVVAPAMAVALADYFVVRRRALDTAALVDGKDAKGDFWFRGGFNPRAALAFAAGAAFPLADFAATAEIGARMVNVVGPGVQTILAPGIALARGAGLGGAVAAAAYLALNRLAPPPR